MNLKKIIEKESKKEIDLKDLPNQEEMDRKIQQFKSQYPKWVWKKLIRTLKKKFPDKEFPE